MEVPGLRLLVEGPGLALLAGEDGALATVGRLFGAPDIPVPIRRIWAASGRGEPGMLIGGVVDHEVEDDPDATLLRLADQLGEVTQTAERGMDAVVVGDVIAVVTATGWGGWIQPQAVDAEARQVVQPADQSAQVTAAVTIRVLKRRHVEAVDDGLLVPPVDHDFHAFRPSAATRPATAAAPAPSSALWC